MRSSHNFIYLVIPNNEMLMYLTNCIVYSLLLRYIGCTIIFETKWWSKSHNEMSLKQTLKYLQSNASSFHWSKTLSFPLFPFPLFSNLGEKISKQHLFLYFTSIIFHQNSHSRIVDSLNLKKYFFFYISRQKMFSLL